MRHDSKHPSTLLCWHSERHGDATLRDTLRLLGEQGVHIERVIYLLQSSADETVLEKVRSAINVIPKLVKLHGPTVHKDIYEKLKKDVLPELRDLPGPLHINVSPGTPAMHTVWLLLHAGGAFPEGTQLWSSQKKPDE